MILWVGRGRVGCASASWPGCRCGAVDARNQVSVDGRAQTCVPPSCWNRPVPIAPDLCVHRRHGQRRSLKYGLRVRMLTGWVHVTELRQPDRRSDHRSGLLAAVIHQALRSVNSGGVGYLADMFTDRNVLSHVPGAALVGACDRGPAALLLILAVTVLRYGAPNGMVTRCRTWPWGGGSARRVRLARGRLLLGREQLVASLLPLLGRNDLRFHRHQPSVPRPHRRSHGEDEAPDRLSRSRRLPFRRRAPWRGNGSLRGRRRGRTCGR